MRRNFMWCGLAGLLLVGCQSPRPLPVKPERGTQLDTVPIYDPARLAPESAVVHMVIDYWTPPPTKRWWQRPVIPSDLQLSQLDLLALSPPLRARLAEHQLWPHWQEGRLQDLLERIDRQIPPIVLLQPHPIDTIERYPVLITGYDLSAQTLTLHGIERRSVKMPIDEFLIAWRHTYFLYLSIMPPGHAAWILTDDEWASRARFYREQGHLDAAMADLRLAIERQPESVLLYVELGDTLLAAGDLDDAIAQYQQALQQAPNLARAANNLAWALIAQGDAEPALRWARHAVTLEPDHPLYLHTLGWSQHRLGQNSEAIRNLQRAQARDARLTPAEKSEIAIHLATIYQAENNPHLARQTLREALRIDSYIDVPIALRPLLD
jgi:Tfp pilus assembly protein PilF